jgi:hypothetical protein
MLVAESTLPIGKTSSATAKPSRVAPTIPPLGSWLAAFAARVGLVWNASENALRRSGADVHTAAGLKNWPKNSLRHCFASRRIAKYENAKQFALIFGHRGTDLVFSNYRELVTPEEAECYFTIVPPMPAVECGFDSRLKT